MRNIKITPFVDDGEKMRDFFDLTKEEFLKSYSYLTEEEYDVTAEYVKEHNLAKPLWVCNHCLCAIEANEGNQIYRVGNARIIDSLADLPKIGERDKYRGLCVSVELYEDQDDYTIYRVFYLDGKYIEKDVDIAYWSYAIHKDNIK